MIKPCYWNHNTAYFPWIMRHINNCGTILDVGCGDGSLIGFLEDGTRILVGIDNDELCIARARDNKVSANCRFFCCDFMNYKPDVLFDAIIFIASIHHMDMRAAINKAKALLSSNGIILIVGLAKPSSVADYLIEGLRVLPCAIISKLKRMHTSEYENIPVSYNIPPYNEVRNIVSEELPLSSVKQGLYYRYLLIWHNN